MRCELSDLLKDQCHHCRQGYPTLGPMDGGVLDGEDA